MSDYGDVSSLEIWLMDSLNLSPERAKNMSFMSLAPPQTLTTDRTQLLLASLYMILCAVGLFGNTGVTAIVGNILCSLRGDSGTRQLYFYVVGLSIADSLCLMSIPMIVSYMLLNNWLFGTTMCKIYLAIETQTKLMSTFILTAVSLDRYMSVCHPSVTVLRKTSTSVMVLLAVLVFASLLIIPLPMYAEVVPRPSAPVRVSHDGTVFFFINFSASFKYLLRYEDYIETESFSPSAAISECQELMPRALHKFFTLYTFILGFAIPGCVIAFCYLRILAKIRKHSNRLGSLSKVPLRMVTRYSLCVVSFYLLCLTPYWLLNATYIFTDFSHMQTEEHITLFNAFWSIHTLPYVNSAFNWVFYALLNRELRATAADMAHQTTCAPHSNYEQMIIRTNASSAVRKKSVSMYTMNLNNQIRRTPSTYARPVVNLEVYTPTCISMENNANRLLLSPNLSVDSENFGSSNGQASPTPNSNRVLLDSD